MNIILVDTNKKSFLPLTYTRPVADLRIGIFRIWEKWEKLSGEKVSFFTESYLSAKYPTRFEEVNVFINSKFLPTLPLLDQVKSLEVNQKLIHGSDWVACCVEGEELNVSSNMPSFPADTDTILEHWWDLYKCNGKELQNDIENNEMLNLSFLNDNIYVIGDESQLYLHPNAKVDGVSFNTTYGPIYVDEGAEIMEGSLIRGPFAILSGATVKMGAKIYGATTIGPKCKVGGEVKNCVFQGFSNKVHEGYIGNSVVGQWVNLGADTNCSNLKNTMNEVKVWDYQHVDYVESGEQFIGSVIGDYSKTAINTSLNTGTTVGINCNVFGEGLSPKFIPNFSWGQNDQEKYNIDKAVETQKRMEQLMAVKHSIADEEILRYLANRREF